MNTLKHLLDSKFTQKTKSLLQSNTALIDIKLIEDNEIVIYIYDEGANNVMTIEGKVIDTDKNKQD